MAKYDTRNAPAIKRLVAAGAQLRPFSVEIMDAAYNATIELFTEVADKNPTFKKLYDSMSAFRNESDFVIVVVRLAAKLALQGMAFCPRG